MSDALPAGINLVRHPRARRARLSIDPASGAVRLTIPQRAAAAPALRWAQEHAGWIAAQRARLPAPRPFVAGASLIVADRPVTIAWDPAAPRRIAINGAALRCGGPVDGLARRITAWLKREALALLSEETAEFAALAGVSVAQVAVGDAKSRWGSCASSGVIRYSWRLILAPGWVRRATVAHEVAHRVHMNHGAAFHALVGRLVGADADRSRAWLRANGAALHWFGRDS